MNKILIYFLFLLPLLPSISSCTTAPDSPTKTTEKTVALYATAFPINDGFGYMIYADTNLLIKQAFMPGKSGKISFKTKASAIKVADLVIYKLSNNIYPPTINQKELDSLLNNIPNEEI